MLEEIYIASVGSYSAEPQRLAACKPINFIFGTNGSGKTTISRVVHDPSKFPNSRLTWSGGQEKERLVFNSDFAAKNFSSKMRGIFTLGEDSTEIQERIAELNERRREYEKDIRTRNATLSGADGNGGKRKDLADLRAAFEETCWNLKNVHDGHFKEVFEGLRNSKTRFCDRILSELESNTADLRDLESLKIRAKTVFKKNQQAVPAIIIPAFTHLIDLESDPIFSKKVVGKENIDIATLIERLGNSDWVQRGRSYLPHSGDQCPFCQQKILTDLEGQLGQYFDESYLSDLASISRVAQAYDTCARTTLLEINEVLALENLFLNNEALKTHVELLKQKLEINKRIIETKRTEPSRVVVLETLSDTFVAIVRLVEDANTEIANHNNLIENLAAERSQLISQTWKFILYSAKSDTDAYKQKKTALDRAIEGLTRGIKEKEREVERLTLEITELERSITSAIPTVNAINSTLSSFGFTGFKLETAPGDVTAYTIIRADGSDAAPTLSEGEKSFITFLYFYHLVKGSFSSSGSTEDRIIVIDDPVSSLDSDVLFIVSTLIKELLKEAATGTGQIRQVFVLTHNIYFHKEVSFDPDRRGATRNHETFWIVRKREGRTMFERFDFNPIKTSYELLWSEVKNPNRSAMTIQNTLRRILENYFKILGNLDKDDIIEKFEGRDKLICGSLFSWVNDGSHAVHDDMYVSTDQAIADRHLIVFKAIFEKTGHKNHYDMMMGNEPALTSNGASAVVSTEPAPQRETV